MEDHTVQSTVMPYELYELHVLDAYVTNTDKHYINTLKLSSMHAVCPLASLGTIQIRS